MRYGIAALCAVAWLALLSPAAACDASDKISGAGAHYFMLAEGDSITFGQDSTDGKGSYVERSCVPKLSGIETINTAVSGAWLGWAGEKPGTNSLYGRMASDNAILAAKKGDRIAILTILIGRNDLTGYGGGPDTYADNLVKYIMKMRRAGWDRVIVGTLLPSAWDAFTPPRDDLNSILTYPGWARAHGIDAIADFASSPVMGPDPVAADKAFYADGIHPTNRGYALLAPIYDVALKAVIAHRR